MEKKSAFATLFDWIKSTELFERPSKKIPGKWKLYEYYIEPEDQLLNFKEERISKENILFEIEFQENGNYIQNNNMNVPLISKIENGNWSTSKNFITLINPNDFRNNTEFQFAFEEGKLKLLKREITGKIEFFGFFKSAN